MTTIGFLSSIWTPQKAGMRGNEIEVNGDKNWWDRAAKEAGEVTAHIMGASLYYRGGLVASMFKAAGMGGWCSPRHQLNPDGSVAIMCHETGEWQTPDVLWTQLVFGPDYVEMTRSARAAGQVVLADVDDDYWDVPKTNYAHHKWATAKQRGRYFDQLAACDAIIVSTDSLGFKAARLGRPVFEVRNPIDTEWLTAHDPAGLPCGWVGSTPWRSGGDLKLLKVAGIGAWLAANRETIIHCGHIAPTPEEEAYRIAKGGTWDNLPPTMAATLELDDRLVQEVPHVPFTHYPRLWDRVGVSLVPLENVSFNRSKSWLKGLESCAAGVPFVCSWLPNPTVHRGFPEYAALGDEIEAAGGRFRTFRNDRPTELLDHLDELLDDDVRRAEGAVNRRVAEANDIRVRWVEWLAVLREVTRLAPPPVDRVAA